MTVNSADKILTPIAGGQADPAGIPSEHAAVRPRPRQGQPGPGRKLARPAVGLVGVVLFQLLFASVFLSALHRPVPHHAPVAVVGVSSLASAAAGHGGEVRLIPEPTAAAARSALRDQQVYAAIIAGPHASTLLVETAASPGTVSVLTKGFTAAAAALKMPLTVRDLAPLPASDPAGGSAYFLVAGWVLGGYVGATVLGMTIGGVRSPGPRQALLRLALLGGYAVVSGFAGALLFGPALGIVSGFSPALAGIGILIVAAAAAATAGLQGGLGMPGTLIAVIAMVVFGNSTAGQSIATPLLASPWNHIGVLLPPSAGLSGARSVLYLGGVNLAGPLTVLAVWVAAGTVLMLATAAWRKHRAAAPAASGESA